jgi:hypothetical protein
MRGGFAHHVMMDGDNVDAGSPQGRDGNPGRHAVSVR